MTTKTTTAPAPKGAAEIPPLTPSERNEVDLKLAAAKVYAEGKLPYLAMALYSLFPVESPGLGTFASDEKWRFYYDPKKVLEWSVKEIGAVILHEVGHCLRGHGPRFREMREPSTRAYTWNIAGDVLINDDLRNDGLPLPEGAVHVETLQTSGIEADANMSTEQVYNLICEKAEENCPVHGQKNQAKQEAGDSEDSESGEESGSGSGEGQESGEGSGSGSGSESGEGSGSGSGSESGEGSGSGSGGGCTCGQEPNGELGGWDCGSAADGVRRAYEAEGEAQDKDGVSEDRADLIRQKVAVSIKEHSKTRGTVAAGWERFADELLNPVVDWRKQFATIVRRTTALIAGMRDYTYSRPSRRTPAVRGRGQNIILPALRAPKPPKIGIVVDTSGSMTDEMLAYGLSEIRGILRTLGASGRNVNIITCDMDAHAQRVTRVEQIKLLGGGGTDMRVGIAAAMESKGFRPDVVVLFTDGYTPYPDVPLRGTTLIVALTETGARDSVPDWARVVVVDPNQV